MKQVFALPESAEWDAEWELLKGMLEEAGIRCGFRNEQLSQALPATPFNVAARLCQVRRPKEASGSHEVGTSLIPAETTRPSVILFTTSFISDKPLNER